MEFHPITVDFAPDRQAMLVRLGLDPDSDEAGDFLDLLDRAAPLARPKAALGSAAVEIVDPLGVVRLDGVEFESRLLAVNLKDVAVAWPYLATCGRELYDFVAALPDPFERYWGDEILQFALSQVRAAMEAYVAQLVYDGKTAAMSPGSLEDWPIIQQRPLFSLLGAAVDFCGVTLTDTMLMLPNKTISGVRFPNEHGYVNCRLCPKERCPNRRAVYDPDAALMGA